MLERKDLRVKGGGKEERKVHTQCLCFAVVESKEQQARTTWFVLACAGC